VRSPSEAIAVTEEQHENNYLEYFIACIASKTLLGRVCSMKPCKVIRLPPPPELHSLRAAPDSVPAWLEDLHHMRPSTGT